MYSQVLEKKILEIIGKKVYEMTIRDNLRCVFSSGFSGLSFFLYLNFFPAFFHPEFAPFCCTRKLGHVITSNGMTNPRGPPI